MSEESKESEKTEKIFQLKLAEFNVNSGSVGVTWCLSKEWLSTLTKFQMENYYVCFATVPMSAGGSSAEWRGYAKLTDMMAFITFLRPGKVRIIASIVSTTSASLWMKKGDYSRWVYDVVSYPETDFDSKKLEEGTWNFERSYDVFSKVASDHIDVDMPNGCFASEPSDFEKAWVNWLVRSKAIDQCDFRRRRIFAYTVQPIVFLSIFLFRLVMATLLFLCGQKGISINPLIHPLSSNTEDVWEGISGNYLVLPKSIPEPFCWFFVPFPIAVIVSSVIGKLLHHLGWGIAVPFLIWGGVIALLLVIIAIGFFFMKFPIIRMISEFVGSKFEKWMAERDRRLSLLMDKKFEEDRAMLACNVLDIKKFKDLPKSKKTIKLRFLNLKSAVCKPFSR